MPKPFDLEAVKSGAPVQTKIGGLARVVCCDRKSKTAPVIALLEFANGREVVFNYTAEGIHKAEKPDHDHDLVMVGNIKEAWVSVYRTPDGDTFLVHPTKEIADSRSLENRKACIRIAWEED